ncbi:MAG: AzlD domain-containing protein [Herminiimonas sp.]|nr:AzlD domain-containing protein [Herminiimonas sp.]
MSTTEIWIAIALLTLATLIARSSLFLLGHAVKLPPKLLHALRYAPAAALAAIIAPDLLLQGGTLNLSPMNPKLLAAICATLFFLWTRHLLGTIVVGMLMFSVLRVAF